MTQAEYNTLDITPTWIGGKAIAISYNKLWKMLIDKSMTKIQLRKRDGLTTNVIAKMGKGQFVQAESLYRICEVLGCGLNDISEIVPDQENVSEEIANS